MPPKKKGKAKTAEEIRRQAEEGKSINTLWVLLHKSKRVSSFSFFFFFWYSELTRLRSKFIIIYTPTAVSMGTQPRELKTLKGRGSSKYSSLKIRNSLTISSKS